MSRQQSNLALRLIGALILILFAACAFSQTYTTQYHFAKPLRGQLNWDGLINGNWDSLDSILQTFQQSTLLGTNNPPTQTCNATNNAGVIAQSTDFHLFVCTNSSGTWQWQQIGTSSGTTTINGVACVLNSSCTISSSGASYTNVVASSSSDTTVAAINAKCSGGQTYVASVPITFTAGGTINSGCTVSHWAGGVWSGAVSITFNAKVVQMGDPTLFFNGPTVTFSSTNTNSHSVQDLAPFEWWGAVGDNSTDNTTKMQACLNALPVQCLMQGGVYKITSALSITTGHVGIAGQGWQTSNFGSYINQATASADIIDVAGTDNSAGEIWGNKFNDFTVYHSLAATGTAKGLSFVYVGRAIVERVTSQDSVYTGYFKGFEQGIVRDSVFDWGAGYTGNTYGVYIDGASAPRSSYFDHNIVDCTFIGGSPTSYGLYMAGQVISDVYMDEFSVQGCSVGGLIDGTTALNYGANNIHIRNPHFDSIQAIGLKINGVTVSSNNNVNVTGGTILMKVSSPYTHAVEVDNSSGISFTATKYINGSGYAVPAMFYITGSNAISVVGNEFDPADTKNTLLIDHSSNITVTGNTIYSTGTDTTAIISGTTLTGSSIGSNNITGNSGASSIGISLDSASSSNTMLNNSFANVNTTVSDANGANTWNDSTHFYVSPQIQNIYMAGTGTRCVQVDATGHMSATSSGCGSGSGLPTGAANGDIIYYNGLTWVKLAGNNSGTQCLQENSSGTPSWGTCGTGGGGGSGTGAMTMIAQNVVSGSSTTSITFSSIPSTYTDLLLVINARASDASLNAWVDATFNTDTAGADYDYNNFNVGNTGGPGSQATTKGANFMHFAYIPAASQTANPNSAAQMSIVIPSYAAATFNKSFKGVGNWYPDSVAGDIEDLDVYGLWRPSTPTGITQIVLTDDSGGHFIAGSTFTLYGVGGTSGGTYPAPVTRTFSSNTITFTTSDCLSTTYNDYELRISNVVTTSYQGLIVQTSTDGGTTWDGTAANYPYFKYYGNVSGGSGSSNTTTTTYGMSFEIGGSATNPASGTMRIYSLTRASTKQAYNAVSVGDSGSGLYSEQLIGFHNVSGTVNAIKIGGNNGTSTLQNVPSGTIVCQPLAQ